MRATDRQVRKLIEEMAKHENIGRASRRADLERHTGGKYVRSGKLPSELEKPRHWRTRVDPFAADWAEIEARLQEAPELEAKTILEELSERRPGVYSSKHLRTLQRRVHAWRVAYGPPKEVFFAQAHIAGEALQTDFTHGSELGVTIAGAAFPHLLCHVVLPYSNWEWATVCQSESMAALKRGVQDAVFRLGRVPRFHQTDNSSAATHDLATGKRGFNAEYLALMRHLKMEPRTIEIGKANQNGDVEAANGVLKRRLRQHLLVRRSSDFASAADYEEWLKSVVCKANALRCEKVTEELEVMREILLVRLPEYKELEVRVSPWSTIRVMYNAYSVPSRFVGELLRVRLYEERLEVYHAGEHQLTMQRVLGRGHPRIDYRHIIWSLVQKPGAFERYRYREELFPSPVFRRAYDRLTTELTRSTKADLEYLRVLHLAASTMESTVETALLACEADGVVPLADRVKALVSPSVPSVPALAVSTVDLSSYDELLGAEKVGA